MWGVLSLQGSLPAVSAHEHFARRLVTAQALTGWKRLTSSYRPTLVASWLLCGGGRTCDADHAEP